MTDCKINNDKQSIDQTNNNKFFKKQKKNFANKRNKQTKTDKDQKNFKNNIITAMSDVVIKLIIQMLLSIC